MPEKIIDYILVDTGASVSNKASSLAMSVKAKMEEGYIPYGSPFGDSEGLIFQAMVKIANAA